MSPRDEKLGCLERDCPGSADSQFISNMIGHVSGNLLLPFSVLFLPLGLLASTISGQLARPESESDRTLLLISGVTLAIQSPRSP